MARRLLLALFAAALAGGVSSLAQGPTLAPPQTSLDSLVLAFRLPEPASLPAARTLWATHYYVYAARAVEDGYPLLGVNGNALGPRLSGRDWCLGAIEGTIRVTHLDGSKALYNYHGLGTGWAPALRCRARRSSPTRRSPRRDACALPG
jgi:hypothetical protein